MSTRPTCRRRLDCWYTIGLDDSADIMIRNLKGYVRKLMVVVPFVIFPAVKAADDPSQSAPASPPLTMARFYVVDSDGRSASDKDIVTQTVSPDQRSSKPRRKKSTRRPQYEASKAGNRSDNADSNTPRWNAAKAWQCERHGFFFTADGRCVQPVFHFRQDKPATTSRRPIRVNPGPNRR